MTKANGESYYSYILIYVDDVLVISEEAGPILARLNSVVAFQYYQQKYVTLRRS